MKTIPHDTVNRRAFTLIELLCVAAIILLLAALLLPALDLAQDKAITVRCMSNQRQVSAAFHLYCSDKGGRFVCYDLGDTETAMWGYNRAQTYPNKAGNWSGPYSDWSMDIRDVYLKPYVTPNTWRCSGAPDNAGSAYAIGPVFGRSGITAGTAAGGYAGGPVAIGEIPYPATTAMLGCKIPAVAPNMFLTFYTTYSGLTWTTGAACTIWPLHGPWQMTGVKTRTNVARVDGSVRTYEYREIAAFPTHFGSGPAGYSSIGRYYLLYGTEPKVISGLSWVAE